MTSLTFALLFTAHYILAYNDLSFARCDAFHRKVLNVTVLPASVLTVEGRQVQDGNTKENSTETVTSRQSDAALFTVIGECRDCPVSDSKSCTFPVLIYT